ncbi:hypothetical protein NKI48_02635 [Mesorhizobium sp. M0644]|uniref:hypothetical protein n=1 Tax=Mesorhizobium sp. M0644 TaxID=2956979 RepID=UPI003339AD62
MAIELHKDESFGKRFEGKWISVNTLANAGRNDYPLTIKDWGHTAVFNPDKGEEVEVDCILFDGTEMGLILNSENYSRLVRMFGPPTNWTGKRITLYVDWSVSYRGHEGGVRIKLETPDVLPPAGARPIQGNGNAYAQSSQRAAPADARRPAPQIRSQPEERQSPDELDDEIPF